MPCLGWLKHCSTAFAAYPGRTSKEQLNERVAIKERANFENQHFGIGIRRLRFGWMSRQ
jgi:hypothetical protein